MKFIFLGRGGLLTSIVLKELIENQILPTKVIIEDDGKSPYPNLTKKLCIDNNLEHQILSEFKSVKAKEAISGLAIDFVLVASLGSILKSELLSIAPFFNVHMGVLPDYRGALTNFWKIKNGDEVYGVTIHKMDEKIDAGDICMIEERNFDHIVSGFHFFRENYRMAAETVIKFLKYYQNNNHPPEVHTDKDKSAGKYYPKFQEQDLLIDLSKSVAFNYKFINRIQFYGNPHILVEHEKCRIKNANLLLHHQTETTDDPHYEIKRISEYSVIIKNKSGVLELKL